MTNKIGIGVSAEFDTSGVEQKINALGQKIAQANKAQFKPVTAKSLEDIDKLVKKFDQLLKINTDLSKRMKATGQGGAGFLDVNWDAMYPDQASRSRQMRKAFEYVAGPSFQHAQVPPSGASNRPTSQGPTAGTVAAGIAANTAQAGMRAAGPAGNVAANSLGTGMSAGFGAGLMGLMGGMLALGVGKLVGAAMENLEKAQQNDIGLDKLKRMLGDVNVGFSQLKTVVNSGADNLKITYDEAGRLSAQFARLGNLSGDKYTTLPGELGVGVGMSRAYGLDPAEGVGVMGRMRGIGATKDTQDSRRFALLIGETIGKSGAFAKADQVMEAMATYTETQTRNNMGVANTAGYAGMFASMVGSGIPGLDPTGAGALLGRINASLSAGGAKGEASQYFTGMVGVGMGLNPYQTRMMREGGAFSTADGMFGEGSAYARYKGRTGPKGSQTFLSASLGRLRQQYGEGSDELADATANHLGIGINQAMALLSLKPNEMGEMSKFGDLTKLSGSGIGNLSKVLYGSGADRAGVATSLMNRGDVSKEDKAAINAAMSSGNEATQKEVLSKLTAQYDQERTVGSDIRDQKNIMDNIKTNIADKMVPAINAMRAGIIYMAGKGSMSERDIMKEVEKLDSKDRMEGIKSSTAAKRLEAFGEVTDAKKRHKEAVDDLKKNWGGMNQQQREAAQANIARLWEEAALKEEEVRKRILALEEEKEKALKSEVEALKENLKKIDTPGGPASTPTLTPASWLVPNGNQSAAESARLMRSGAGGTPVAAGDPSAVPRFDGSLEEKIAAAEKANGLPPGILKSVIKQETGGKTEDYIKDPAKYHYGLNAQGRRIAGHTGQVSTAFGPFGILESTAKRPGYGVAPLKDKGLDEQIRFASEYLAARARSAGSIEGGLAGYGEGQKYSNSVMSRMRRGVVLPSTGTPIPDGGTASNGQGNNGGRFIFDPLEVIHKNERGERIQPNQRIAVNVHRSQPFGTTSYA